MKRLKLLACVWLLGYAAFAEAQAPKSLPRLGIVLPTGNASTPSPLLEALRRGLQDLGYSEGKNIAFELRHAEGKLDQVPKLVNELVQQKVDILLAANNVAIRTAKEATKSIPILMISSIDPVAAGYVINFARPGGNITGYAHLGRDLSGKRLELLKEIFPKIARIAVLWDMDGPGPKVAAQEYEATGHSMKVQVRTVGIRGPKPDFSEAFNAVKTSQAEALVVVGNPLVGQHQQKIFESALAQRVPTMTEERRFVRAGGMISYGPNLAEVYRGIAGFVDLVLKGAKPNDLSVKHVDKFEIFVNLKSANQLGVTVPKSVLGRATEVIE